MKFFYDRTETDTEVVIVYRPYSWYLLFGLLAVYLVSGELPAGGLSELKGLAWAAIIALMVTRFFAMRGVNATVREAMKKGAVQMSGSSLSPKNPLTARIPK